MIVKIDDFNKYDNNIKIMDFLVRYCQKLELMN